MLLPAASGVVLQALAAAAFGYVEGGNQVVCDGIVGPWFIDLFRPVARERDLPLSYVVLLPGRAHHAGTAYAPASSRSSLGENS